MKITMNWIKKNCTLLLASYLISYVQNVSSQSIEYDVDFPQYIPKAPTAYSFAKYIDYPVSLYTGIPDISIPLYEIQVGNLKIPISISYHASGITASQEATRVGLGWNLNAGGIISRTIKCGDDFQEHSAPNGLYKGYLELPEAKKPYAYGFFGSGGDYLIGDSEPDIFFYSLPSASGKFILGKDSVPVLFDKGVNARIRLKFAYGRRFNFEVTTPDGTLYVFDKYEETSSYNRDVGFNLNHTSGLDWDITNESDIRTFSPEYLLYVSSWFLSKIVTNTNDTVAFTYTKESYQLPIQESATKQNILSASGGWSPPSWGGTRVCYSSNKTTISTQRLSKISWRGGEVDFECTDRADILKFFIEGDPKKISAVKVIDRNNNIIKNYEFEYDYFNNGDHSGFPQVFKRLKLLKLIDKTKAYADYAFSYADGNLPPKNTKNTDYWGYYNGSNQKEDYYCPTVYDGRAYGGGDKNPRFQYMKMGILESVKFPTGGTTTFTYEPNKYYAASYYSNQTRREYLMSYKGIYDDNYSELLASDRDTLTLKLNTTIKINQYFEYVGKMMISDNLPYGDNNYPVFTISQLNSNGTLKRIYSYPIPSAFKTNNHYYALPETIDLPAGTYIFDANAIINDTYFQLSYEYEEMVKKLGEERMGGGLRIAKVEGEKNVSYMYEEGLLLVEPIFSYIQNKRALKDVYYSTALATYLVQNSESVIPMTTLKNNNIFGYGIVTEIFSDNTRNVYTYYNEAEEPSGYPFLPSEINYYNGLLQNVSTFNNMDERVKSIDNVYSYRLSDKPIYAFVYRNYEKDYPYVYRILWPYLSYKKNIEIENSNNPMVSEYNYTYNDYFQIATESFKSGADAYTKKYIYPTDQISGICSKMKDKYIIGFPIETLLMKSNSIIKGKRITYEEIGNMILPQKESSIETTVPLTLSNYGNYFKPQLQFSDYNLFGIPMHIVQNNDNRVYLWSYNSMYPVAEIKNATYQQVAKQLSESFIQSLAKKNVPSEDDINRIRALQASLSDVLVSTYTYRPLVGMTSITDSQGFTTHFNYDASGRLSESYLLNNGVKSTLQQYECNYGNE